MGLGWGKTMTPNEEFLILVARSFGWGLCGCMLIFAIWIAAGMPA